MRAVRVVGTSMGVNHGGGWKKGLLNSTVGRNVEAERVPAKGGTLCDNVRRTGVSVNDGTPR